MVPDGAAQAASVPTVGRVQPLEGIRIVQRVAFISVVCSLGFFIKSRFQDAAEVADFVHVCRV